MLRRATPLGEAKSPMFRPSGHCNKQFAGRLDSPLKKDFSYIFFFDSGTAFWHTTAVLE